MECCGHAEIVYAFQSIEKERKYHHGAVGKLSSEQQFRKCDGITFAVVNFWSYTPSVRPLGRLADKIQTIFKIHYRSAFRFI